MIHFDNLGIGPKPFIGAPYVTLNENVAKREVAHVSLSGIAGSCLTVMCRHCASEILYRDTENPTPSHLYLYCASHTTVIFHTLHFLPVLLPPPSLPPLTLSLSFLFSLSVWTPSPTHPYIFYFIFLPSFIQSLLLQLERGGLSGHISPFRHQTLSSPTEQRVLDCVWCHRTTPNNHNGGNVLSIQHKAPVHWPSC